MASLYTVRLPF
jgi:hypothetical protein